jgi:pilus assembly protein CpaB
VLLLSVALASGGLAASEVHERERRAAQELGPLVDVLVAAADLPAGARVARRAIAVRRVPARFAPPDGLVSPAGVIGARVSVPVRAGSYLSPGLFRSSQEAAAGAQARRGERTVTVGVAGGGALEGLSSGARVDVLVSTEAGAAGGRTVMALAGAELVRIGETPGAAYPDPDAGAAAAGPTALATLRVSLRQAIYLTAADNFAREIRLLYRPPGDPSSAGGTISQSQL